MSVQFCPELPNGSKSWAATDGKGTVTLKVVPTVEVSGGLVLQSDL